VTLLNLSRIRHFIPNRTLFSAPPMRLVSAERAPRLIRTRAAAFPKFRGRQKPGRCLRAMRPSQMIPPFASCQRN